MCFFEIFASGVYQRDMIFQAFKNSWYFFKMTNWLYRHALADILNTAFPLIFSVSDNTVSDNTKS